MSRIISNQIYDTLSNYDIPERRIDVFGHHMHGKTSSYGEVVQDQDTDKYSLQDFIEGNYGEEGEPVKGLNHVTDYVEIRKKVPKEINLLMNDTPHFHREEELYDDIYRKVEEEGGEFRKFDKHIYFEIDGKEAVVINSSEVGVTDRGYRNRHFTVTGLEMGYEEYADMSLDELTDLAKEAEITSPCHPFMPMFQTGKELLYGFLEETRKGEFDAAINYSTGYFPLGNELTRGEYQKYFSFLENLAGDNIQKLPEVIREQLRVEKTVTELAEEYDLPILPEIDSHAVVPEKLEGFGVLEEPAMKDFREGRFPAEKLKSSKIINYGFREGTSVREFFQSFGEVVPGWDFTEGSLKGLRKKLMPKILNYPKKDFEESFEKSLESLEDMDIDEVVENSYDPLK